MAGTPTHPASAAPRAGAEEALNSVLGSRTFARAEKLQRFLKYVCELTFRGDAALVHEHLIAVEVFGRGDEYSPGEDSVVRRQAHALRRKLKDYYETEGKDDRVQIELPLGSYVPVFRERQDLSVLEAAPTPEATTAPAPVVEPPTATPSSRRVWKVAGALLVIVASFGAGWLVSGRESAAQPVAIDANLKEIWGPWLSGSSRAVFCFSNPPTTSVRLFAGPIEPNPEHQGIPVTREQDAAFRQFFRFPAGGNIYVYPLMAQAKMGEALAAVSLTSFFAKARVPVHATQSRFVTWETLRHDNVIVLGHADSNQWIEPVLRSAPFTLSPTDQRNRARILNHRPGSGEQPNYTPTLPDANKSYALVSMLPGVDGTHEILVIGGLDTSSTTAAAEFMMSPEAVRGLLQRLRSLSPDHRGTWHFQAILETDIRDTVALKAFPIALRVL